MRTTVENYVVTIHAGCDEHERRSKSRAQSKLRQLEQLQSAQAARPVARGLSRRSAVAAWDRLRSAGLLPSPRIVPVARPLPDTSIPAWMQALREDEIGLAWIVSVEFPSADPVRWIARARSIARDDRAGRYDSRGRGRSREAGVSPYAAADAVTVGDWLARDRDTVDECDISARRMSILRDHLGHKLADSLAAGMTQQEAATLCRMSVATVERRLAVARKLVSSVS